MQSTDPALRHPKTRCDASPIRALTSFDNLVSACEQHPRHVKAKRLGGLEIEHELEPCRLLNWQVARMGALEDEVDVLSHPSVNSLRSVLYDKRPPASTKVRSW